MSPAVRFRIGIVNSSQTNIRPTAGAGGWRIEATVGRWITRITGFLLLLLFSPLSSPLFSPLFSQSADDEFRLRLDVGNRWITGFHGSNDLYRTQLDLGEGPKLFSGELFYAPAQERNRFFDRLQVNFNNWGGEPFNAARLQMGRNGVYELSIDYRNAHYFSAIPSFANPLLSEGNLDSQHRFDVSQRTFTLDLVIRPGSRFSPYFLYQRSSRSGPVRTTLPADGDEFLLQSDQDLHSDDVRGGVRFHLSSLSVQLEQGVRWYRDRTPFLAQGFQQGNSTRLILGREVVLSDYSGINDVDARMPYSTAALQFRPHQTLQLGGKVAYSMADVRSLFSESIEGSFVQLRPVAAFYSTADNRFDGRSKRPNLTIEATAEWRPAGWIRIMERFHSHRFHVSGASMSRLSLFGVEQPLQPNAGDRLDLTTFLDTFLGLNLETQEIQALVSPHPQLTLRAGHRFERKKLELESGPMAFSWDRNVLILGGTFRHSSRNRFTVDYELGRTSRAILRLDPVDFHRLRLRGNLSAGEKLEFNGSLSLFDHQNPLEALGFDSNSRTASLGFTYNPVWRLSISGQYERVVLDTEIFYIIPQTFSLDRFFYDETGNYGNLAFSLGLPRNANLSVGYAVWGNTGSFPVNSHHPFARLEVPIEERVALYGEWNFHDYNEKLEMFPQDYRLHLLTFGLRFSLQ